MSPRRFATGVRKRMGARNMGVVPANQVPMPARIAPTFGAERVAASRVALCAIGGHAPALCALCFIRARALEMVTARRGPGPATLSSHRLHAGSSRLQRLR